MISYTEALKKLNYAPAKQGLRAARRGEETDAGTGAKSAPAASYSDALRGRLYDAPAKTALTASPRSGETGAGMGIKTAVPETRIAEEGKKTEKNRLLENMNSLIGSINTLKAKRVGPLSPETVSFRRFLPFFSLQGESIAASKKNKNHSKISRSRVPCSFHGADLC
ncbi:MAG: hypothetical protein K5855_04175 [Oscillospiraceae bacterium]|nr:hypothetical protein [Oscillospiraceae bacterium]